MDWFFHDILGKVTFKWVICTILFLCTPIQIGIAILMGILLLLFRYFRHRMLHHQEMLWMEKQKAEFYLCLSHDFKSPVNIIAGLTEKLQIYARERGDDQELKDLSLLSRQSDNLFQLIDQLNSIAHVEQDKTKANTQHGDLIRFVHHLFQAFAPLARKKHIRYSFDKNVSEMFADYIPVYLHIIIRTMITGALKPAAENDSVEVRLEADMTSHRWHLRVTGPRACNGLILRHRADTSLLFSRKLAIRMNGTLVAESMHGNQTTYTLTLPLLNGHLAGSGHPPASLQPGMKAEPAQKEDNSDLPRLMIVSGEKDLLHYLYDLLHDHDVTECIINGHEALQRVEEKQPEPVITDNDLFLMNGREHNVRNVTAPIDKPRINVTQFNERQSLQFLEKVTETIYREIDNTQNLIDLIAANLCISKSHLNRKIKAATGLTTSQYILKVRLNKAKKMLARSQKPIGEIALDCGFNDFAYFSRIFHKEFGMTPTAYQRLPHMAS